jgi:hypothetical protein
VRRLLAVIALAAAWTCAAAQFALPRLAQIQQPANVHFTAEGSEALAEQVAASISRGRS